MVRITNVRTAIRSAKKYDLEIFEARANGMAIESLWGKRGSGSRGGYLRNARVICLAPDEHKRLMVSRGYLPIDRLSGEARVRKARRHGAPAIKKRSEE